MDVQYTLHNNELVLNVKKASMLMRGILFLFSTLSFAISLVGIFYLFFSGGGQILFTPLVLFFALLFVSLFVFRLGLWNTYGKEAFFFGDNTIYYQAYYGWFKDKRKKHSFTNESVSFSFRPIGFVEEQKGVLLITIGKKKVGSAVKLPIEQLKEICDVLTSKYDS